MGTDAPDWQNQIIVNPSVATNLPIDIDQQSLPVMTTGPVQLFDVYKRTVIQGLAITLTTLQTLSAGSLSGKGCGGSIRLNCKDPYIQVKVEYDGVLKTTTSAKNLWDEWGGHYFENEIRADVLIWDEVNDLYVFTFGWGWKYIFNTTVEIFVYNPTGGSVLVNRVALTVLEER